MSELSYIINIRCFIAEKLINVIICRNKLFRYSVYMLYFYSEVS